MPGTCPPVDCSSSDLHRNVSPTVGRRRSDSAHATKLIWTQVLSECTLRIRVCVLLARIFPATPAHWRPRRALCGPRRISRSSAGHWQLQLVLHHCKTCFFLPSADCLNALASWRNASGLDCWVQAVGLCIVGLTPLKSVVAPTQLMCECTCT